MSTETTHITPIAAAEVLWFHDEGGQKPNSFKQLLIAAIVKADGPNRHKLRQAFPEYVAAVEEIQTPGSGVESLRVIAEKLSGSNEPLEENYTQQAGAKEN